MKEREIPTKPNEIIDELVRLHRLEEQGINTISMQEVLWEKLEGLIGEDIDWKRLFKNPE